MTGAPDVLIASDRKGKRVKRPLLNAAQILALWLLYTGLVIGALCLPVLAGGSGAALPFVLNLLLPPVLAWNVLLHLRQRWNAVRGFATLGCVGIAAGVSLTGYVQLFNPEMWAYCGELLYVLFPLVGHGWGIAIALLWALVTRSARGHECDQDQNGRHRTTVFESTVVFVAMTAVVPTVFWVAVASLRGSISLVPVAMYLVAFTIASFGIQQSGDQRHTFYSFVGIEAIALPGALWLGCRHNVVVPSDVWSVMEAAMLFQTACAPFTGALVALLGALSLRVRRPDYLGAGGPPRLTSLALIAVATGLFTVVGGETSGVSVIGGRHPDELVRMHYAPIVEVELSPDGTEIMSLGEDGAVRKSRRNVGEEVLAVSGTVGRITAFDVSWQIDRMVVGTVDGTLILLDVQSGNEIDRVVVPSSRVCCVKLLSNAALVLSVQSDIVDNCELRLWDVRDSSFGRVARTVMSARGMVVAVSADGSRVAIGSGRDVWVLDTASLVEVRSWRGEPFQSLLALALSPDGGRVASVIDDEGSPGIVHVSSTTGRRDLAVLDKFSGQGVAALTFLEQDRLLVIGMAATGSVQIVDVETRRGLQVLRGLRAPVSALDVSADGSTVAAGDRAGMVGVWALEGVLDNQ